MTDLHDAAGLPVTPGTLLLADNGKVWRVKETDEQIARVLYANAAEVRLRRGELHEHGEPTYVPAYLWLVIDPSGVRADRRLMRKLFDLMHARGVAPRLRAEALERHRLAADHIATVRTL